MSSEKIGWFIAVCICITLATTVPAIHGANSITVPSGHILQGLGRHLPIFHHPVSLQPYLSVVPLHEDYTWGIAYDSINHRMYIIHAMVAASEPVNMIDKSSVIE